MGYFGKIELKNEAIALHQKGLSYNEILKTIPVSKDTLSRWCREIELTNDQKARLMTNKENGQRKGSLVAAGNKRRQRIEKIKNINILARKDIGKISKRDNFIFGLALYAGEGGKTDGKGTFTNSNPFFIKFMCKWLMEYCDLNANNLKGALWIHEENDEKEAKIFWSNLTEIPIINFHKSYVVKNKNGVYYRKNVHPFGVFSIRFYNSDLQRKIMGWISAFLDDKITSTQEIESIRDSSMVEQETV